MSESELSLDFSDEDYQEMTSIDPGLGGHIDPELGGQIGPGPGAAQQGRSQHMDYGPDDDFPEPLIFSDLDGFELGHDDLNDGFTLRDNIKAASGFKVRRKPKSTQYLKRRLMRASDKSNDPEVRDHLSKANEAFVRSDLTTAWKHYMEVIKLDAKNFNAYRTLGEICQMRGDLNRCCLYWLLAAECGEADGDFWGMVAQLSAELGHVDQAIHCYTKAMTKLDHPVPVFIEERALLYKQKKQYGRALEGFQRLLTLFPTDASIIKQLANIYVDQKRENDAINLYMRVLENNMEARENLQYPAFTWTELNITCDLFVAQQSWVPGIKLIKLFSRWKQKRQDETWWDADDDDAEFDLERRLKVVLSIRPAHAASILARKVWLPIDIRFKLGFFRLQLDQKEEALSHFKYLFEEEDVLDLCYEAGIHLEEKGLYEDAIQYLECLYKPQENLELAFLLGKCYLEIEKYADSKRYLFMALRLQPDDVDTKLTLIEALYHTEDMEMATQLMEDVSKSEAAHLTKQRLEDDFGSTLDISEESAPAAKKLILFKNLDYYKSLKSQQMTNTERDKQELKATRLVLDKYHRMLRLQEAIDQGHRAAANAWIKIASQLIEMFMEVKSFFPKNKKTAFRGILRYNKKKTMDFDDKILRISNILEGITKPESSRTELTSQTEFRGLDYDTWLYIFVQQALLIHQFENDAEDAAQTIEVALDVSVFVQDKKRSLLLRLVRLMLGMFQGDYATTVSNNIRYILSTTQFSPTIYDFFMCCFSSGVGAWAAFSNYNHQKYYLRQLKAYDSLLTCTKISGAAQITIDSNTMSFLREHPHILYIYACLLGSNRTYSSPIVYLTRAYRQYYNDPTICFVLGLSHIHRSMQRNSANRHIQLLQGISYLMEYKALRLSQATIYEKQETEYNFGRLFHMIGLTTLAIKHYENVLAFHEDLIDDPDYDMLMEAAYNLTLIYTINGNTRLSQSICDKYLTV